MLFRSKSGLFMDIACAKISTKPKSCINIERLSELGVNLDMSYDTEYRSSSSINTGRIEGDGFVSKYELDDTDNRAMFATLNHIGFIPQSYQESINSYETQIKSKNTNYFLNKFKYIYPTDFDGRLSTPMSLYKKGFAQAEEDRTDEEYLTFRFGAENGKRKEYNSEGRWEHNRQFCISPFCLYQVRNRFRYHIPWLENTNFHTLVSNSGAYEFSS